jgi:hypothetical protein
MRRRALVLALLFVGAVIALAPYARGIAFVVRAADIHGIAGQVASTTSGRFTEREVVVEIAGHGAPNPHGPLRGRLYVPARPRRFVLLVSGLHAAGIDEPRLVAIARHLAESGIEVATPAIPELERYQVTPAIADDIEAAAGWLASDPGVTTRDGRVGLIGISFSGGLSVVAAGRPSLKDKIAYVLSLGGHDDLPRVLHYLCTGLEPPAPRALHVGGPSDRDLKVRPPHDYGVAVMLLGVADRLVPRAQVEPLRAFVLHFLSASSLDSVDKARSETEFAALRHSTDALPEPARRLAKYVNDRDVVHLGALLLPFIEAYASAPAMSASRSPLPSAPVFLLHGIDDNVVPAVESEFLAERLRGHVTVRLLETALISHAALNGVAQLGDINALAAFWGDLLAR